MAEQTAAMLTLHPVDDVRVRYRELQTLNDGGFAVRLWGAKKRLSDSGSQPDPLAEVVGDPMNRLSSRLRHHLTLFRRLIKDRPSVVHLHEPETLWLGLIARPLGCKVIYDVHEYHELLYARRLPNAFQPLFERVFVATERLAARLLCTTVLTVTPQLVRRFAEVCDTRPVENFASVAIAKPSLQEEEEWLATRSGVISIGSLGSNRGTELLLDAFAAIAARDHRTPLRIVGRYSRHYTAEHLSSALRTRNLEDRVEVLQNANPELLKSYLSRCGIGLSVTLPGRDADGAYPTKLFEYMAQQLAIVTTASSNSQAIVENAGAGIATAFDPEEIADAVLGLIADGRSSYAQATAGYLAFQDRYCWESGPAQVLLDCYSDHMR